MSEQNFVDLTDVHFHTIHAKDFSFFEEIKAVIDAEIEGALPEELMGALFSPGIRRGALVNRDSNGSYPDGGRTYSITVPSDVPINNYWSFVVYDTQTRSLLETGQKLAGVDSNQPTLERNEDGSFTVWFAPEVP